jgi:cleavage and polyadenylation specificity factor subunit 1
MSAMTKAVFFRFELDDYERVTTMKNIILKSEETVSGMKGFIVLGTTYVYGEDLPCKGRVCDIIKYISSGSDSTSYPGA